MTQEIYLATWDHKHGLDHSIHKSHEGAFAQLIQWAREALEEWGSAGDYVDYTDKELISNWPKISGETEFMWVEDYKLND